MFFFLIYAAVGYSFIPTSENKTVQFMIGKCHVGEIKSRDYNVCLGDEFSLDFCSRSGHDNGKTLTQTKTLLLVEIFFLYWSWTC